MDVILRYADEYLLDRAWSTLSSDLPRDSLLRQGVSLYMITLIGILFLYFTFATASYYWIFDHRMMRHPRFLKNQVKLEIRSSLWAFPALDLMTLPWFVGEVRGHSLLYDDVSEVKGISLAPLMRYLPLPTSWAHATIGGGWSYIVLSSMFFLWFTDLCIYFVHRWEHHPLLYKHVHKPHHKWIIPTPFASHAFHPVDGYAQSLPYHIFVFLFPLHKFTYMSLFVFVNFWSILIHDSEMIVDHPLEHVINGPSHHTLHHIHFTCNYGQYFTWADKVGGSYRHPVKGEDPLNAILSVAEKCEAPRSPTSTLHPTRPSTPSLSGASSTGSLSSPPSPSSSCASSDAEEDLDSARLSAPKAGLMLKQLEARVGGVGMQRLGSELSRRTASSSAATSVDGNFSDQEKR